MRDITSKWNKANERSGMRTRQIPKIETKKNVVLWCIRQINAETTRVLLKWYVGKFPIARRGVKIQRNLIMELGGLTTKDKR